MPRYHTIFFDAGGTLLTVHPSVGEIYAEIAAQYGIHAEPREIEFRAKKCFWELRERALESGAMHTTSIDSAKVWWRAVVREAFGAAADSPRFEAFFQAVFDEFRHPRRYRLFPEVEELLAGLRGAGYRLGIISNWDARLRGVIHGMGLVERVDTVVISGEIGFEKPDRRIYELARERCGALAGEPLLQIGDDLRDDVEGAKAAGFDARLVARGEGQTLATILADLIP